ncbi:hypothetical protein ACET3Z_009306 [Daucus carota]
MGSLPVAVHALAGGILFSWINELLFGEAMGAVVYKPLHCATSLFILNSFTNPSALSFQKNYKVMVIIAQPFGRVPELWSLDMGLGPVGPGFVAVHEDELIPAVENGDEVQEPVVEEGDNDMLAEADGVEIIEIGTKYATSLKSGSVSAKF